MTVEFRLLGEVDVLLDGRRVDVGHARQRSVLAALLVEANRPVPFDQLVERIWADRPPYRARNALSAYLSRLRQRLAAATDVRIAREPGGYVVSVDPLRVDLHRFRHLVRQAHAVEDPVEVAALYGRALDLWLGEPFGSIDTPWFDDVRSSVTAERLAVLLDRNDAALRAGGHGELLGELATAVRAHPLDERLTGQLMLALYRSGRQADALDAYQRMRTRLLEELGADPGAALRRVHQQLLAGDADGAEVLERAVVKAAPITPDPGPPRPAILLERTEPLRRLDELLAADDGRVALVSGEAGVGKSALLAAFAAQARASVRLLRGACDPLTTPRELGPLHDVGRRTGGALAAALAAHAPREEVFAAVLDELDRPPRTVLVIEDAHWADGATLDLLTFLGRRIAATRALLLVTYRDDEIGADHPLHATLATLPGEVVVRLPLAPLSPAGVAELARLRHRPAADIHAVTGGNPLLVGELLAAGPSDVPSTVRDLMLARLAPLPEQARAVARLVSVMPGHAAPAVLAGSAEAVETCLARGVLVATDGRIAYRHELLRRAVEESLSPLRRAELHSVVLAALEGTADPARLAHHALLAGDVPALLRHAPAAARRAAAVDARREAMGHLRAALPHADTLPDLDQAELRQEFAAQAFAAGFAEEGLPQLRRALTLWETAGDAERVGEGLLLLNRILYWTGRVDEAWAACRRAVEVLEAIPPGVHLARAYGQLSTRYMVANRPAEALDWGRRAEALAGRLGDAATAVDALITVGGARFDMEPDWDGSELEQAHRAAVAAGLREQATRSLFNLASTTLQRGDLAQAAPRVERALTVALDRDMHGYARITMGLRAQLRVGTGDWKGARSDAEASHEWPGLARNTRIPGLVALGLLRARTGDADALAVLDEAAEHAYPMQEAQWVGPVAAARSEHLWLAGDLGRAAEEARRWLPMAVQRHRWLAGELALRLWRAEPGLDPPDGLDEPYARLIDGDWAGAAAIWADRGCLWTRAEALVCGDGDAVAEALHVVDSLGATRVAERWRAELRRGGLRATRRPRAAPGGTGGGLPAPAPASDLPRRATSFVGREADIARVAAAVRNGPLVTLTGVGGVGKSRLAVEAAGREQDRFPDGGWLCELAALDDDGPVSEAVAVALRVQQRGRLTTEQTVIDYLRGRTLLLVLDNCEHVIDAAARLVDQVVRHCPGVVVLATSRAPFGVEGEQIVALAPLDAADATVLFADRARAGRPEFRLDGEDAAAAAEICRRLDGLPLAIELAAARMRVMNAPEVARRLDDPGLLTRGARGALAHHRSLDAAVDWSYRLLSDAERALFARLSVFAGGFDLEAAHGVCGEPGDTETDTLDLLGGLVDMSMVTVLSAPGRTRFRVLETLRAFGRKRLGSGGVDSGIARAHAAYFARLAGRIAHELHGREEPAWVERTLPDYDNLRTAFDRAVADRDADLAMALVTSVTELVHLRVGYESAGWALRALDLAGAGHPLAAAAAGAAARGAWNRGEFATARALAGRAGGRTPGRGTDRVAYPADVLADIALYDGDARTALRHYVDEVARARVEGDPIRLVWTLYYVAVCHGVLRTPERGVPAARESVEVADSTGNHTARSMARYALGLVVKKSEPRRALALFDEAAELAGAVRNFWWRGIALMEAAATRAVHAGPADLPEVAQAFVVVLDHWDRVGDRTQQWLNLRYVVRLLVRLGAADDAVALHHALVAAGKPSPLDAAGLRALADDVGEERFGAAASQGSELTGFAAAERAREALRRDPTPRS